ncbi:hypothetical protein AB0M87_06880 [Streptomyces sp. NPDC051320]|uniref:hypothetical protein n=1 Tax=Streptomyces sp. NPDC051320 TaxID=3154644 RepID=UPI0034269835
MYLDATAARGHLDAALERLVVIFRGMTARADEHNCECHWGSAEELALLKIPDVELDPDLLRRTWDAPDWSDHGAVLRRILPQFATALAAGRVRPPVGMEWAGLSFSRGRWQQWPTEQAHAVREFLAAWWVHSLTEPEPAVPAHEVLVVCAEASATLSPWLALWEELAHPVADRCLAEAVDRWNYDLLADELPWWARQNEDMMREELTAWLVRHAPDRLGQDLRAHGATEELRHRIRLLGLTGPARWDDPHWPNYRY